MADASICGDEVSEDWALINFQPNEDPEGMPPDEFLVMGNSDESVSNQKCGGVLELNTSSEIKLNNTICEAGSSNGPLPKLEVINLISKKNSMHERNSDDGDSIEVLDLDGSYRDADFSELETPDTSDAGNCQIDDLGQSICANDCIAFETRLKKRTLSKTDKTTTHKTLSDSKDSREGEEEEKKEDLTVALYKSKFTPVYDHHSTRFKNAVLSLSLGIIIAGMVCIAIGHFLGIQNSTDDLLMIVRKLKLENAALQSQLSQISTALLTEGKPMDHFVEQKQGSRLGFRDPPAKISETFKCGKSSDNFCGVDLVYDDNGQINLKTSGNRSSDKHVVNLGKIARIYIEGKVNPVNDTSKDANLEVCTSKITQALQAALDKLASSQKNLDDLYNKFDVFFSEIHCNRGGKSRGEKGEVNDFVDAKNLTRVRRNEQTQFVPLQFPQPEEYYMKKERNGGVAGESSDGENLSETTQTLGPLGSGKKKNTNDGVHGLNRSKREGSESKKRKKMTQKSYGKERKTMRAEKDENPGKSKKKRRGKNWKGSKSSVGYRLQGSATEEGRSALSKGKSLKKSGLWVFKWAEAREKIRKAEGCGSGNGDWHLKRLNDRKHLARGSPPPNW